ncbi:uncharacterized protein I206_100654 [Kwoniella pini CBS 10737]|uniref:Pre-rRNA-processing protein TSR2 n=1 Tax=Kwoniella pini CBS 10737 TaxID=1296096 RepID=A0A1B9ICL0_9TREE|nr:uncharacterized protein I206_00671 [Kwoniella pini CBS 10737]OCF53369.1 hypothetical protein I206_00671 [Kwoniella pini CBS 10737]
MTEQQSNQQPLTILLFARGVIALLDLWPALTIAVSEEWGGKDSLAKKTWLASILIDEFESRASIISNDNNNIPIIDPKSINETPLDFDEIFDLLNQIMSDEFDANLEDGSIELISNDLIKLWKDLLNPLYNHLNLIENLEKQVFEIKKKGIKFSSLGQGQGGSNESQSEDEDEFEDEDDSDIEMNEEEIPQLIDNQQQQQQIKEKQEPIIDDDGFTLVQKKGGKK